MLDDMRQAQALRDMETEALQEDYGNDHIWVGRIGKEKKKGSKQKPMCSELRCMMIDKLRSEYREGRSLAAVLVDTLLQIAVTPDEFTEDAAVNAARLIWEILK